jgi:hypothetical protein
MVAERNPQLETVNVAHCPIITEASIRGFVEKCPRLKYLDMEGCYNVLYSRADESAGSIPGPEWETESSDDGDSE